MLFAAANLKDKRRYLLTHHASKKYRLQEQPNPKPFVLVHFSAWASLENNVNKRASAAPVIYTSCMHHNFIMAMARLLMLSDKKKQLIDKGSEGRAGTGIDTGKERGWGWSSIKSISRMQGQKKQLSLYFSP